MVGEFKASNKMKIFRTDTFVPRDGREGIQRIWVARACLLEILGRFDDPDNLIEVSSAEAPASEDLPSLEYFGHFKCGRQLFHCWVQFAEDETGWTVMEAKGGPMN